MVNLTRASLGRQLRSADIGWSAAIDPVPKTGRVRFSQIGNLARVQHTGAKNIDLTNTKLQQMIGEESKRPIGPGDFKGAIWSWGKTVTYGDNLPPPRPDEWMSGYINEFPGSRSLAAFNVTEQAMDLTADTRSGAQENWGKYNESALVYYVGRLPAGTKVRAQVSMRSLNQEPYGKPIYANVRGWRNGWFDDDFYQYVSFSTTARGPDYENKSGEFTVTEEYSDIWVTCEVVSNDPRYSAGKMNQGFFKDWKLSLA